MEILLTGVDRQAMELFGLICYGEFRKKIGICKLRYTNSLFFATVVLIIYVYYYYVLISYEVIINWLCVYSHHESCDRQELKRDGF